MGNLFSEVFYWVYCFARKKRSYPDVFASVVVTVVQMSNLATILIIVQRTLHLQFDEPKGMIAWLLLFAALLVLNRFLLIRRTDQIIERFTSMDTGRRTRGRLLSWSYIVGSSVLLLILAALLVPTRTVPFKWTL